MKKHLIFGLLALLAFCIDAPSASARSLLTNTSPDTLELKGKVYYKGKKVKKMSEFKTILETAHDAETMRRFSNFKTLNTLGGVGMLLTVGVVGIPLMIVGLGQRKKAVRRFNNVIMGRAKPVASS